MSRIVRRSAVVALAASLVAAGFIVAAPAAAAIQVRSLPPGVTLVNAGTLADPDYTITVDCALIPDQDSYDFVTQLSIATLPIRAGSSVRVELVNCVEARMLMQLIPNTQAIGQYTPLQGPDSGVPQVGGVDWANGAAVPLVDGSYELGPNTLMTVYEAGSDPRGYFKIIAELIVDAPDPSGTLLNVADFTIAADALADMNVVDDPQYYDATNQLSLGGRENCRIAAGGHFWASAPITIESRGLYTFRVADLDPVSSELDFLQPERYLSDPFLALYSSFDPADAHQGVVDCNDDADRDVETYFQLTSDGSIISDRYPQLTLELQPGTYTLVLTSYYDESEFQVVVPPGPASASTGFAPAAFGEVETASVELWFAESQLAATGPSPVSGGMLAAGLALMTLGGLVFASRRVWSRA